MARGRGLGLAVALAVAACAGLASTALGEAGYSGTAGAAFGGPHDPALVGRIITIGTTDNRAMEHLGHLCNNIGARPAGTRSHLEACRWACDRLEDFGLSNVHLEECGEIASGFFETGRARAVKRFLRKATLRDPDGGPVKLYNVVADIPGTDWPGEYVLVGAHLDSPPRGTGAADNAAGVAAVMEAARLLMESGAKPKRTIRLVLFAGEEVGLVGSRGYLEAHPDLAPKITAMYNMDEGSDYISRISATEPLRADLEAVFAPAKEIDQGMPFKVVPVDYLPNSDANCCRDGVTSQGCGNGPTWMLKKALKRNPDGTLEEVDGGLEALGITEEDLKRGEDSQGRKITVVGVGGCGGDAQASELSKEELAALKVDPSDTTTRVVRKAVAVSSSDQAPFLNAGIPSFWWGQGDTSSATIYPAHTDDDTYDKVVPRHLEHSATVIALGAIGTANLDHMLSRERLADPNQKVDDMGIPVPAACGQ